MDLLFNIFILVGLFILSFFFSASETALFSLSKIDKRKLKERYGKSSESVLKQLQSPRKTLSTILMGNWIVNSFGAALITLIVMREFGEQHLGVSMATFTVFVILFCEMLPKFLAVRARVNMAFGVSFPLRFFETILAPLRNLLRWITDKIISLLVQEKIEQSDMISEKELKVLVKIGEEEGVLDGQERYMIQKLLELGERPARDIMTPRTDLIGLDIDDTAKQHEAIIRKSQFSILPIYKESPDQILGVVESQSYLLREESKTVKEIMREPLFVPESKRIDELLELFKEKEERFAVCVDEFGGTAGVVTREDILEEIFGEFYDEYAKVEHPIRQLENNLYIVEGKIPITEFNDFFSIDLASGEASTLGGYLLEKMGVIPTKGAAFETEDFVFTIQDRIRQRIHQVLVRRKNG